MICHIYLDALCILATHITNSVIIECYSSVSHTPTFNTLDPFVDDISITIILFLNSFIDGASITIILFLDSFIDDTSITLRDTLISIIIDILSEVIRSFRFKLFIFNKFNNFLTLNL